MSGIIYKIVCNETGECYVGSTKQSLNTRMGSHKCLAKKTCSSRSIIERNNYTSDIIEGVNYGDNTKIMKEIGWKPNYDLRTGLTAMVEWAKPLNL